MFILSFDISVPALVEGNFHSICSVSFTRQKRTIAKKQFECDTWVRISVCVCRWGGVYKELEVDAGRINSQTRPERVAPFLGDNLTTNECECECCFCILLFVFLLFYTHTQTHSLSQKDTLTCDTWGGVAERGRGWSEYVCAKSKKYA